MMQHSCSYLYLAIFVVKRFAKLIKLYFWTLLCKLQHSNVKNILVFSLSFKNAGFIVQFKKNINA